MESAGIWMLASVGGVLLLTGLPVWITLLGVALVFCAGGLLTGALDLSVLAAAAPRLIGLLEQDLLQALPLYVLMGALLNRLPLAEILFGVGTHAMRMTRTAPQWMGLALGMILAPINGSVGASIAMLSRTVLRHLHKAGVAPERGAALICVASTFGVVIPPSLVLILLGDAMMRAHTEATNITHEAVRIINTQDVFRSALVPATILFLLCAVVAWWNERRNQAPDKREGAPRRSDRVIAIATFLFLIGLLAGVALGYFYAVEGAAAGAVALALFGLGSRTLTRAALRDVLYDTMALSGALFALLVAATMFTLTLRIFGTDRWISSFITELHGGPTAALAAVLLILAICALVLDAFEIIFVVIPIVMPPLLVRIPDAAWVSVIALLMLQTSFLIPPLGYAVLLIRGEMPAPVPMRKLARALLPYVAAQALVLALVLCFPSLTHLLKPQETALSVPATTDEDPWKILQEQREQGERETR